MSEPSLQSLPQPWQRYLMATRPAFLTVSLVACLLGWSGAIYDGVALQFWLAVATLVGVLLAHAGVNVLNDYYDARNGTDATNRERLYPYTGGSRFIQNGVFTEVHTRHYGIVLLGLSAAIGSVLAIHAGPALWFIGALGLALGWAYSAPPLSLNSHGLGELGVVLGFGLLIPLGADVVQRAQFSPLPLQAGLSYGLLVATLLYINQFPDCAADARAGKRHWVVRLSLSRAPWGYAMMVLLAHAWLLLLVLADKLPLWTLLAMFSLLPSILASVQLLRHAQRPARLVPAIRLSILAALSHGLLLSLGLLLVAF